MNEWLFNFKIFSVNTWDSVCKVQAFEVKFSEVHKHNSLVSDQEEHLWVIFFWISVYADSGGSKYCEPNKLKSQVSQHDGIPLLLKLWEVGFDFNTLNIEVKTYLKNDLEKFFYNIIDHLHHRIFS